MFGKAQLQTRYVEILEAFALPLRSVLLNIQVGVPDDAKVGVTQSEQHN